MRKESIKGSTIYGTVSGYSYVILFTLLMSRNLYSFVVGMPCKSAAVGSSLFSLSSLSAAFLPSGSFFAFVISFYRNTPTSWTFLWFTRFVTSSSTL